MGAEGNIDVAARDGLPAIKAYGIRRKRRHNQHSRKEDVDDPDYSGNSIRKRSWDSLVALAKEVTGAFKSVYDLTVTEPSGDEEGNGSTTTATGEDADDGMSGGSTDTGSFSRLRYHSGHPGECKAEDRDPRMSWATPEELRRRRKQRAVHDLYHCGMLWMHGSYYKRAATIIDKKGKQNYRDGRSGGSRALNYDHELCDWLSLPHHSAGSDVTDTHTHFPLMSRRRDREMALSALTLALWMADDLYAEHPEYAETQSWPFRNSPLLSQPIHQALAVHYGFDRSEHVRLPEDLGLRLKDHLSTPVNVAEHYTKLTTPSLPIEADDPPWRRWDIRSYPPDEKESKLIRRARESHGELVLHVFPRIEGRADVRPSTSLRVYTDMKKLDVPDGDDVNGASGVGSDGSFSAKSFERLPWASIADRLWEESHPYLDPNSAAVAMDHPSYQRHGTGKFRNADKGGKIECIVERNILARVLEEFTQSHSVSLPARFTRRQRRLRKKLQWRALTQENATRYDYSRREDRIIDAAPGPTEKDFLRYIKSRRKRKSVFGRETTVDMQAAAAHFFPVAQYAAAHYGVEGSGVTYIEEIFVSRPDDLWIHTGAEDNPIVLYDEAQAAAGDVNAQLMMARRHYWGNQGLEPQPAVAREWYERAAREHNNPEALYNLGVLHANGQGGYQRDMPRAMEHFRQAADPVDGQEPFAMAVYAVGSHYLHDAGEFEQAVDYLVRACHLGSADAHFTLGTLYVDRYEVETGMVHLLQAANAQHVRALNYIAHGLYDPDSWLFMFHRRRLQRERDTSVTPEEERPQSGRWYQERDKLRAVVSFWRYDPSQPLEVFVGLGAAVRIPQPLGSGNTIPAAMHILKHIASMTYRVSDLLRAGAAAYTEHDDMTALEHFSEAAELGLVSAQENAAAILEKMQRTICRDYDAGGGLGLDGVPLQRSSATSRAVFSFVSSVACHRYFKNEAMRRWTQLANNNDVNGKKVMAKYAANGANLHGYGTSNLTEASLLLTYAAELGDVESLIELGWVYHNPAFVHHTDNMTKILFATAWMWETSLASADPLRDPDAIAYTGTMGMAPALAFMWLYLEPWYRSSYLIYIPWRFFHAWQLCFWSIYNEVYRLVRNGTEPPMHSFTPYLYPDEQQALLKAVQREPLRRRGRPTGRHPYFSTDFYPLVYSEERHKDDTYSLGLFSVAMGGVLAITWGMKQVYYYTIPDDPIPIRG